MAFLPQDPKQQKALLGMIMVLGGAYAFHTYWYTPKSDELDELDARVEYVETRNRNAQIAAARGGADLEARIALYERHMGALEALIPASEEVPQLMRTISAQARGSGVGLSALEPETDQPGEHYTKLTWRVSAVGEYDNVGRFLTSIASLPRIATPVDVELAPYAAPSGAPVEYENPVLAQFRIELYVLPQSSAEPLVADAPLKSDLPASRSGG
jgi:type IV pilus assembly protein PilO